MKLIRRLLERVELRERKRVKLSKGIANLELVDERSLQFVNGLYRTCKMKLPVNRPRQAGEAHATGRALLTPGEPAAIDG